MKLFAVTKPLVDDYLRHQEVLSEWLKRTLTCIRLGKDFASKQSCIFHRRRAHKAGTCKPRTDARFGLKCPPKTGLLANVYPKPLKGYENGEAPEFYGPV